MVIPLVIGFVLLFSLSFFLAITMPARRGQVGENKVSRILSKLPENKYKVINDLLLKTSYGITQIDHVVLSEYGIFVIKTKNYSGWIYGSDHSEEWTKNVYGNKYLFRNPLKQNYAHVRALMEVLEITNQNLFIPILAFSNQAEIKVQSSKKIINFGNLRSCILGYQNSILNIVDIAKYASTLSVTTEYTKEEKKAHVSQIKGNVWYKDLKIKQGICPKCGGRLIERKGKYGKFLGCSNYPGCRFTFNID